MVSQDKPYEGPSAALSLPVPSALLRDIRRRCLEKGLLVQDFVEEAIREALNEAAESQPSRK